VIPSGRRRFKPNEAPLPGLVDTVDAIAVQQSHIAVHGPGREQPGEPRDGFRAVDDVVEKLSERIAHEPVGGIPLGFDDLGPVRPHNVQVGSPVVGRVDATDPDALKGGPVLLNEEGLGPTDSHRGDRALVRGGDG
jgi:hypothetical protein